MGKSKKIVFTILFCQFFSMAYCQDTLVWVSAQEFIDSCLQDSLEYSSKKGLKYWLCPRHRRGLRFRKDRIDQFILSHIKLTEMGYICFFNSIDDVGAMLFQFGVDKAIPIDDNWVVIILRTGSGRDNFWACLLSIEDDQTLVLKGYAEGEPVFSLAKQFTYRVVDNQFVITDNERVIKAFQLR